MQEQLISGWKTCKRCAVEQPLDEFQLRHGRHGAVCRPCLSVAQGRTPDPLSHKARAAMRARGMKVCCACKKECPLAEFYPSKAADGLMSRCKPCVRASARERYHAKSVLAEQRRRAYGIGPEECDAMLVAQGHRCAICRGLFADEGWKRACVDHSHATGIVRGVLCGACNVGLGKFADDPVRLRAAVRYLERSLR